MRIPSPLALAAAAAVVATSLVPAGAAVLHQGNLKSLTHNPHALVAPGRAGQVQRSIVRGQLSSHAWMKANPDAKGGCVYLSDNLSLNVDFYSSASPYSQLGSLGAVGGWGVAASKKSIFVGNGSDVITGYTPCSTSTNGYTAAGHAGGSPYGMAADKKGNLWANEWPTATIDWWGPSGGSPSGSATEPNQPESYFLALDKKDNVYPVGYNAAFSSEIVDACSSTITGCTTMISNPGGFPGGDALDRHGNVYLNDQFGTLHSYTGCPSACTSSGSFTYSNGTNPLDYTAIQLDTKAKNIWGANIYFCSSSYGLCGDGQLQSVPLSSATLGGTTSPAIQNAEPLGLAVWKPAKP